jgi:hypothetical protein
MSFEIGGVDGYTSHYSDSLQAGQFGIDTAVVESNFLSSKPPRPALEFTQPSVKWAQGIFPGHKPAEAWR